MSNTVLQQQMITDSKQLIEYMESGCKKPEDWVIGTENEKFVFDTLDLYPLTYDGERGIYRLLTEIQKHFNWHPVFEAGRLIALEKDQSSITLEPGGQLELSGYPHQTLHQTCAELKEHLRQINVVGQKLQIGVIGLGFHPKCTLKEIPHMPKSRFEVMQHYLPTRGRYALDMMYRTCSVQVNLDFADEPDMVRKLRVSLALHPIATALFANSPFKEGKPNGYQTFRAHLWSDMDPDRCGDMPFVFEDGFGFERYVEYALDVPMYFIYRDNKYVNAAGLSFREFLKRRLEILPGQLPTLQDWEKHLTTLYPDVRMKKFLEMRNSDCGPYKHLCALPSFWVGLLYDQTSLDAAWDIVKNWKNEERAQLRADVPIQGLQAQIRGRSVRDLAFEVLNIAYQGLRNRDHLNEAQEDETSYLEPLWTIVESNQTSAQYLVHRYYQAWQQNIDPIFTENAY